MIKFDDHLEAALRRLEAAADALPEIAQQVQQEALGHLILGANANIYNTTPGAYERTRDYLRSLDAKARASRDSATVTVGSDSEYARLIEFGRQHVSAAMLQQSALAQRGNAPLTMGRSGLNWWQPGPVITGAQVFADRRLRELFVKAVRGAVR